MAKAYVQLRKVEIESVRKGQPRQDANGRSITPRFVVIEGKGIRLERITIDETLKDDPPIGSELDIVLLGDVQSLKRQMGKQSYDVTAVSLQSLVKFTPAVPEPNLASSAVLIPAHLIMFLKKFHKKYRY